MARLIGQGHHPFRIGRAGAVALVTAMCAPMLLLVVGFVVDFGYASYINQCLARASDDATVGAVSQTAATAAGGYANTDYLQATGTSYFNANIAQLGITGATFDLSVVPDNSGGVVANGKYSYNVPTFFAGILGFNTIPVSGVAKSSAKPATYVNYYVIVDASQSMGIASTEAAMDKLYTLIVNSVNGSNDQKGCVFGCHVKAPISSSDSSKLQPYINEELAHKNNIELRIDAAVAAVKSIIGQAQAIAGATKNIKFGLFTIQLDPSTSSNLHVVATPSNDYGSLQSAASTIELGNNNSSGAGDSDIANELIAFNNWLTSNKVLADGSGASDTAPLNYFLLVTDGLTDVTCGWRHCTGPVNPSNCSSLKKKGTVAVIYTTYQPIYKNNDRKAKVLQSDYADLVDPYQDQIRPNLKSCASSADFFFEASDGPDIVATMQTLFAKTQPSSARLTQ